jgi:hypothetical protein
MSFQAALPVPLTTSFFGSIMKFRKPSTSSSSLDTNLAAMVLLPENFGVSLNEAVASAPTAMFLLKSTEI